MLSSRRRAANRGQVCPTNTELARQLALKNGEAARYEFNQLVAGGHIRVANFGPLMRRVVTIVASGKTTAKGALLAICVSAPDARRCNRGLVRPRCPPGGQRCFRSGGGRVGEEGGGSGRTG